VRCLLTKIFLYNFQFHTSFIESFKVVLCKVSFIFSLKMNLQVCAAFVPLFHSAKV